MKYQDEQTLINQLLAGSEEAYRYAVNTYHNNMLYVAKSIVGPSIADEVVQEAWISVLKALPKFEGRSSLKTWILRIVSNNAKTRLRKESRSIAIGDASDMENLSTSTDRYQESGHWSNPPIHWNIASPEAILSSEELKTVIYAAIDKLPPVQQCIISLRDMNDMSMEEICKILDISESNSRVLLHRARTKIWQSIEKFQSNQNVKM
ncbi:MAG TPA: sigma-70 family RNA polymerase sigma factor [Gammaproteobacteria bacterium]|nr:sigma-70 family RNA polymerase sigma factor [Gammaproteobacteria bacterium]